MEQFTLSLPLCPPTEEDEGEIPDLRTIKFNFSATNQRSLAEKITDYAPDTRIVLQTHEHTHRPFRARLKYSPEVFTRLLFVTRQCARTLPTVALVSILHRDIVSFT